MKKEKLVDAMSLADDKYVWEARPGRSRNNKMRRLSVIAACLAVFVTAASLWLFVPYNTDPPDVSQYADSEYYDVIKQLNVLTYRKPSDKNNYEKYIEGAFRVMEDSMGMMQPDSEAPMEGESAQPEWNGAEYGEVTDNQVAGVIEGDLFKRSRTHLYYLHGDMLYIYNIAGEESVRVGEFRLPSREYQIESNKTEHVGYTVLEMYLSQDGKTVTLVANGYQSVYQQRALVAVISLDVSDPKNVTIKARAELSGSYTSSRMVDGKLLLMSEFYVGMNPDFSDESTFLPQLDTGEGPVSIPAENIILPEKMDSRRYTVVSVFDEGTLQNGGVCAFLSYSQEVYVSPTTVYATHGYSVKDTTPEGYTDSHTMTEISAVHYADGALTRGNTFAVDGYVKDQYSMDEYDGMLRVVTTTDHVLCVESGDSQGNVLTQIVTDERTGSSASLYVFDDATGALLGSVEHFAPVGETVESVRFDGTAAYVCTAVVATMTDPVFFFDLSDPANITYTDTGVIEGYSTSLVELEGG
ncbi:MAG: beta-propeller domain-containing protein, partial [Clostridia bacterium]|nr:beta-propeller domain-containing protein [Clostridia bacterium]